MSITRNYWNDRAPMLLENVLYLWRLMGLHFCFSAPRCLCLCPCPFPLSQSPSFSSVSCQNRAELLECLWGMAGRSGGRRQFLSGSELYLSIAMGAERCIALHSIFCCIFHFCRVTALRAKSDQLGNEKLLAGRRETLSASRSPKWHWPLLEKVYSNAILGQYCFGAGVNSISVCIRNIRR